MLSGRTSRISGLRILVVEDEMMLALLMEDWLQKIDCEAVVESRLEEALARAAGTDDFNGALLDVNLAGERSYPVAENSRSAACRSFS